MSVEQTHVVDFIGIDNVTGKVVLTISDHLRWGDEEHLLLLQEKLNTYLMFIENGELIDRYPDSKDRKVEIKLLSKYIPDKQGCSFLETVTTIVEGAGFEFRWSK